MNCEDLFHKLYAAKNEQQVTHIIECNPEIFAGEKSWKPLGDNYGNIGTVETQQSNATAALVEKVTNSIDAILMKKCLESDVNPKSVHAPKTVDLAIDQFFLNRRNWDLSGSLKSQALEIQIIADSEPRDTANTSLTVYDNGEGQHPEDFEKTFLSLHSSNKNEIHFVQGRYNMGGSGAIMFCGRKRYQLIASKRHSNDGDFGFTLVRQHPMNEEEEETKKNHWYEYFVIDDRIPSFSISAMDLGLFERKFITGSIIKLYSYYTEGNRNIRRDMSRSINEFLYEPALPFYVVEKPDRYPKEKVLQAPIFGLKRQLRDSKYLDRRNSFSETIDDLEIGEIKVEVSVFKNRVEDRNPKQTRDYIQREFFKNKMVVLFSLNGQVQGHFGSDFVTKTLKFNILKESLLVHIDCTSMKREFRQQLFMPDRERLRKTPETKALRDRLGNDLRNGPLKDIYRRRLDMLSFDSGDSQKVLKDLAKNLPMDRELHKLLSQTFKLDDDENEKKKKPRKPKPKRVEIDFNPQRYPTFFRLSGNKNGNTPVAQIPLGGSKTLQFDSDVENEFFDRVEDPGDMKLALLHHKTQGGGDNPGLPNEISGVLSVNRSSSQNGQIKVVLKPTKEVYVGDELRIKVDLISPVHTAETFQEILWVKIAEAKTKPEKVSAPDQPEPSGLPECVLVYQAAKDEHESGVLTWKQFTEGTNSEMSFDTIMFPLAEGETLRKVFINMNSSVFMNYKSKFSNISHEQEENARNRYISSIFFHTIFLYTISRKRKYEIKRQTEYDCQDEDLEKYLSDVFSSNYAEFLLNFGTSDLMRALS
ncbi:MAG: ATP-binding protein [Chloroflexi bacterium]|nr:ATP-binding protein [Chloroflexota bacterium]